MSTAFRFLTLAAALALVCGCGGSNPNIPATISGRVTYKGTPLPGGNMLFTSQGGGAYPASIGTNGEYTGREFPVGDMTVTIETETLNPERKMAKPYPGKGKGKDKVDMFSSAARPEAVTQAASTYMKVPAKYADAAKSGLKVTLKAGKQTQDFELTD